MSRSGCGQRGSTEPVAFLGVLPIALVVILALGQIAAFGYTLVVAEAAARDALRAASVGDNPYEQVRTIARATGVVLTASATCDAKTGRVSVKVVGHPPALLEAVAKKLTVIREVDMPAEGKCGP